EDLVRMLHGQPDAGIADAYRELPVFGSLRLDGELARPIHILHRVDAVRDEVHHDLLQLHAISHDLGKICRQLRPDRYEVSRLSLLRRRTISRMTSLTSTSSCCGVALLKSRRVRLMISAARVPSSTILIADARASSRFGVSPASQFKQAWALAAAAALG